jgi:zinc transport system substrate-binding protein
MIKFRSVSDAVLITKLWFFLVLVVLAAIPYFSYSEHADPNAVPTVLVSVAPHKFFVEKIAGDTVKVDLLVPVNASAHTYEPTPRQMVAAGKADIWFRLGESFETRLLKTLSWHHPHLVIVDMRHNVDMISADPQSGCSCCYANSQDLHIWLSARQSKIQVATIARALSERYPEHQQRYQKALETFIDELDMLDKTIATMLKPIKNSTILVSHPAYAYFCRDYDLVQLSIEFEGKDPTPQQLNKLLNQTRAEKIKKVFIQIQYGSKGARLIANELKAELMMLDPYSENYFDSMLEIARSFASIDN